MRQDDGLRRAIEAAELAATAARVESALARADERLVELGLLPPHRTRAEKRARKAGRRAPNDGTREMTNDQIKAARRAKARKARKGKKR